MAKSLCAKQLLPLSPLLQAAAVGRDDSGWLVKVDGPEQAACPHCSHRSAARHSRYVRTVKDLPAFGAPVSIQLRVNRFRCLNNGCAAQYFTAGLPGVAARRGRRTCRADTIVLLVGHALGGRPGERLIGRIGLPVSDDPAALEEESQACR